MFIFRVDASQSIGFGHVSRCLALAEALSRLDIDSVFVCKPCGDDGGGSAAAAIEREGYPCEQLPAGLCEEGDAQATIKLLRRFAEKPAWLAVDHYGLGAAWEVALRPHVRQLLAIDDLARPHVCDALLDHHGSGQARYEGKTPAGATLLLGPQYALLKPAYARKRQALAPRSGQVNRILVAFGGSDPDGITLKTLQALERLSGVEATVDAVMGAFCDASAVETFCRERTGCDFYHGIEDVSSLMAKADVAIGAGGVMALERCCLGLPSLVIAIAKNQEEGSQMLHREEAIHYLGPAETLTHQDITEACAGLFRNAPLLRKMSRRALTVTDGLGAERAASALLGYTQDHAAIAYDGDF